jgi:hypothetical protein
MEISLDQQLTAGICKNLEEKDGNEYLNAILIRFEENKRRSQSKISLNVNLLAKTTHRRKQNQINVTSFSI